MNFLNFGFTSLQNSICTQCLEYAIHHRQAQIMRGREGKGGEGRERQKRRGPKGDGTTAAGGRKAFLNLGSTMNVSAGKLPHLKTTSNCCHRGEKPCIH